MREILLICRIVVLETSRFGESLAQLDFRTRELVAYVECNRGERRFPMAGVTVMGDQSQLRWQSQPLIRC